MKRSELTEAELACVKLTERQGNSFVYPADLNGIYEVGNKLLAKLEPELKKVDMSKFIGSNVLMEFTNNPLNNSYYGFLLDISNITMNKYLDSHDYGYMFCRPKLNYINAWTGGECPLPEGLNIKVYYNTGGSTITTRHNEVSNYWDWGCLNCANIIAFEILGLADGWEW